MKLPSLSLGIFLFIQMQGGADAMTFGEPPNPGMSDEYLNSMGRRQAVELLLFRLSKAEYEADHAGIVDRLDRFLELSPNPEIVSAFDRHARSRIANGKLYGSQIQELCLVLYRIGARGGAGGVAFLLVYLGNDSPLAQVPKETTGTETSNRNQVRLAGCALRGIGLSGLDSSEEALSQLRSHRSAFAQSVLSENDFDESMKASKRVRQEGIRAVFKYLDPNPFERIAD